MPSIGFREPFDLQVEFLRRKLDLPTATWRDIWQGAHDRAFVVAGATKADLLADLHAAVVRAAEEGRGIEAFRAEFDDIVTRHGWTGWTGGGSEAGIAWRTRVIYQTNMATSYAAGRWAQVNDPDLADFRPYIKYHHADGVLHPRPWHVAWSGLVLPKDHPFWETNAPPNGWGCHCYVSAAGKKDYEAAQAAGKTEPPPGWNDADPKTGAPVGIDKGWAYNPGASRTGELQLFALEKSGKLPPEIAADFMRDVGRLAAPDIRQALAEAEAALSDQAEEARVFAPDGRQILAKHGDFSSVTFTAEELAMLTGNIVTHSHPGIGAFSPDDIKLAAAYGLAEIRAVDARYRYSMAPEGFDWDWHWWARAAAPALTAIRPDVANAMRLEGISGEVYNADYWHRVWERMAIKFPLRYRRALRSGDGTS